MLRGRTSRLYSVPAVNVSGQLGRAAPECHRGPALNARQRRPTDGPRRCGRLRAPPNAFGFTLPVRRPTAVVTCGSALHASANSKCNTIPCSRVLRRRSIPHGRRALSIGTTSGLFSREPSQSGNGLCALGLWWIDGAYWLRIRPRCRSDRLHTYACASNAGDGVQLERDRSQSFHLPVAIARAGMNDQTKITKPQPTEVRRLTGTPARNPVRSRHRTSTTAAKAWPTTIRRAATPAARDRQRNRRSRASLGRRQRCRWMAAGEWFELHRDCRRRRPPTRRRFRVASPAQGGTFTSILRRRRTPVRSSFRSRRMQTWQKRDQA